MRDIKLELPLQPKKITILQGTGFRATIKDSYKLAESPPKTEDKIKSND